MTSLTKNPNPPTRKCFFRVQTRRLASFEPLNSSLPLLAPSYARAKPHAIWLFRRKNPQKRPDAKMLTLSKPVWF